MTDYPTIQDPNGFNQSIGIPAERKESESGYTMSFCKATSSFYSFELFYDNLTDTERDTLQTFFDINRGLEFTWYHPENLFYVPESMFSEDELDFSWISPYYWSTTVKFVASKVISRELVTNGGFDDTSWWTAEGITEVVIAGSVCTFNNAPLNYALYKFDVLTITNVYELTYDVTDYTSGDLEF